MVGSGRTIPTKDEEEIGLPARKHLGDDPCCFVILVDDLEHDRREQAQQVFDRYRSALDAILTTAQQSRASVHFLVNMLEAYYFADATAINSALNIKPPLEDHTGDVESIRHPKNELRRIYPGFREIEDGGRILNHLNIERVLSRLDSCGWLRTLFAWCVKILKRYPDYESISMSLEDKLHLDDGLLSAITQLQLDNL